MKRWLNRAIALSLVALACLRVFTWFDGQFYLAEMLVHFTLLFALASGALLLAGACRGEWKRVAVAALLLGLWVRDIPGGIDPEPLLNNGTNVRFAQYNVSHSLPDHKFVLDWLKAKDLQADVVALQEVTPELRAKLATLSTRYPYQILPASGHIDLAFLSRWPLTHAQVRHFPDSDTNYIIADVLPPGNRTPLRVYTFHTLAPTNPANEATRNRQMAYMGQVIGSDTSPLIVLAGDFNNTSYSPYFRDLMKTARLANTMEQTGSVGTWPSAMPFSWMRLSIDNLLASPSIAAEEKRLGPRLASDHMPVLTMLRLPEDARADADSGLKPYRGKPTRG